jgi:arylsulfate sulfotransferase
VHGLYAAGTNIIRLEFFDESGVSLGVQGYQLPTGLLNPALPLITIQEANRAAMADGMTLVSYFGHDGNTFPQRPFIFDSYGKIRWYLDYASHPVLNSLFYDDGITRLANGNFYFGAGGNAFGATPVNKIFEVDLFGNVINSWDMPGYAFHHQVQEKPDGNFLVTVNKLGVSTIEDYIIEIDRENGDILNEWDLNQSLENSRDTWTTDTMDWIHVNALYYDATDDTIVISGRTQGVVKLTADNKVVWILAPHKAWGLAGDGEDLNEYLLQPLDALEQPITNLAVLEGDIGHPEFEWQWYQHAPSRLANGDVLLFDNGDNRNYGTGPSYSRAVRYRIDEAAQTVQQIWEYGKSRGTETYSRIVSDVDYLQSADNVLFSPGAIQNGGTSYAKCIEVDYTSGEVVFEATIIPPTAFADIITLHRTERLSVYPP